MRFVVALLVALLAPLTANAWVPSDETGLNWWVKADANVYKDAGTTPAVNNDLVQQANDQTANAGNLSQATSGNRPTYKTNIVNSKPVIRCDGSSSYMTGPAIWPTTTSYTLVVAGVLRSSSTPGNLISGATQHALFFNNTTTPQVYQSAVQMVGASVTPGEPFLLVLSVNNGSNSAAAHTMAFNLTVNGNQYRTGILDVSTNTTDTAMQLCAFGGANFGQIDFFEGFLYDHQIGLTTTNNITTYFNSRMGTSFPLFGTVKQYLLPGDSFTAGFDASPGSSFASLLQQHSNVFAVNMGSQGAFQADLTSQFASVVQPLFEGNGIITIVLDFTGTNDFALAGSTPASVFASEQSYCAAVHAAGGKFVTMDMAPRTGLNTQQATYNALLDADTCADAHVATTCNTPMWAAGANTDGTWYNTGNDIHWISNGHSIAATCLEAAFDAVTSIANTPYGGSPHSFNVPANDNRRQRIASSNDNRPIALMVGEHRR